MIMKKRWKNRLPEAEDLREIRDKALLCLYIPVNLILGAKRVYEENPWEPNFDSFISNLEILRQCMDSAKHIQRAGYGLSTAHWRAYEWAYKVHRAVVRALQVQGCTWGQIRTEIEDVIIDVLRKLAGTA